LARLIAEKEFSPTLCQVFYLGLIEQGEVNEQN